MRQVSVLELESVSIQFWTPNTTASVDSGKGWGAEGGGRWGGGDPGAGMAVLFDFLIRVTL